jgi:biotin synthase-like enzyme
MYCAGANGIMVGNYLTTRGRTAAMDQAEISALGLGMQ